MSALLEIEKLCVWYGPVFALKDATLSVGSGEAVALIGANGAGKSTLFKSIVGFQRPKSGALRFIDRDLFSSLCDFSQLCWALVYWASWCFEPGQGSCGNNSRPSAGVLL